MYMRRARTRERKQQTYHALVSLWHHGAIKQQSYMVPINNEVPKQRSSRAALGRLDGLKPLMKLNIPASALFQTMVCKLKPTT